MSQAQFTLETLPKAKRVCLKEGCDERGRKRGFCPRHYSEWYRATYPERVAASERRRREATREYHRQYYVANREKFKARSARRYASLDPEEKRLAERRGWARSKYGLTLEEYDALIARGCAICGMKEDENRRGRQGSKLCVDHDHANGKVRDALCTGCNFSIGAMDDDSARLLAAADYIDQHKRGVPE